MKVEIGKRYIITQDLDDCDLCKGDIIEFKELITREEAIKRTGKDVFDYNKWWYAYTLLNREKEIDYMGETCNIIEKNYMTELTPKPFIIYGKTHQLQSIWEDLEEMGYKATRRYKVEGSSTNISSDHCRAKSLEDYKYVFLKDHNQSIENYEKFHLPQDYQKALDYCADALKNYRWEEEYKVGEWLYFENNNISKGVFKYNGVKEEIFDSLESYQLHLRENTFTEGKLQNYYCGGEKVKGKATEKQIQEVLTQVAKLKGYKEGNYIQSLRYANQQNHLKEDKTYLDSDGRLWMGDCILYQNGYWAKIVDIIRVAGHKAKYDGEYVKFGCQTFNKIQIKGLMDIMSREQIQPKLTIMGEEITPSMLEKLLNQWK